MNSNCNYILLLNIEPANATANCPRQNGYFAHSDPTVCDQFFFCSSGQGVLHSPKKKMLNNIITLFLLFLQLTWSPAPVVWSSTPTQALAPGQERLTAPAARAKVIYYTLAFCSIISRSSGIITLNFFLCRRCCFRLPRPSSWGRSRRTPVHRPSVRRSYRLPVLLRLHRWQGTPPQRLHHRFGFQRPHQALRQTEERPRLVRN
jgi:hypothetical protein